MGLKLNKQAARWAGVWYLLLIPVGFFGVAYVPYVIVEAGDAAATARNLGLYETLQRRGLVAVLVMNLMSVALVLTLYELFKSVSRVLAGFMVALLLLGAGISMMNEASLAAALALSVGTVPASGSGLAVPNLVGLLLEMHGFGQYVAVLFWGLWLFPLGVLAYRSGFVPRILGVLLIVAGIGYVVDSFTYFLAPAKLVSVADVLFVGEATFTIWLLIAGLKSRPTDRAPAVA